VTQQNAARVEDAAAASVGMRQQALQLQQAGGVLELAQGRRTHAPALQLAHAPVPRAAARTTVATAQQGESVTF
jgi:hypothetical protein